jgi:hypothetical protein
MMAYGCEAPLLGVYDNVPGGRLGAAGRAVRGPFSALGTDARFYYCFIHRNRCFVKRSFAVCGLKLKGEPFMAEK